MEWLYRLGVQSYGLAVKSASPFNSKAKKWIKGRAIWKQYLSSFEAKSTGARIWFHAASVGEFEQARPIIESLKRTNPSLEVILTFFSPSGFEMHKSYELASLVMYLPLDTAENAKQFLASLKPDLAVFVKYEFWFYFLKELKENNIPTYLISAIFREDQHFFKPYGSWFRVPLSWYAQIFVQNRQSYDLLKSIGLSNLTIAGDTRLDRVLAIAHKNESFEALEVFGANNKVFIVGSSWDKEDEFILELFNEEHFQTNWKLIIAPHEIDDKKVNRLTETFNAVRFSELTTANAKNTRVVIGDGYGYLSKIYKYAQIALVGGGFHTGIHSILEPAAFGCALIFGPHNKSFAEASDLVTAGGGYEVVDYNSFREVALKLMNEPEELSKASSVCRQYIAKNKGASQRIVEVLKKAISDL